MLCRVGGGHPPRPSPAPFVSDNVRRAPRRRRAGHRTARTRRAARRATRPGSAARSAARLRATRSGRRCRPRRRRTGRGRRRRRACSARRTRRRAACRGTSRASPVGSAVTLFATTRATTPSRSRIGSISSWKPAETISGSCSRRAPRSPDGHGRARAGDHDLRRAARVTVAISREITSSSVSRRPSSSSSAPNSSGSPKRSLTMWSVSISVTVPSQSRTSARAARR